MDERGDMRENWPQWLRDAQTSGADVSIVEGVVHWHSGKWHGGVWHGGVWHGGVWRGGTWHGGNWLGGADNPTRCSFRIRGEGDTIHVGCWTGTLDEAKAMLDGGELPEDAPDRDSSKGRLLRRAVIAQIAWQEAE